MKEILRSATLSISRLYAIQSIVLFISLLAIYLTAKDGGDVARRFQSMHWLLIYLAASLVSSLWMSLPLAVSYRLGIRSISKALDFPPDRVSCWDYVKRPSGSRFVALVEDSLKIFDLKYVEIHRTFDNAVVDVELRPKSAIWTQVILRFQDGSEFDFSSRTPVAWARFGRSLYLRKNSATTALPS